MRVLMRLALRPKKRRTPAPFVVGVARSGTTLLRLMLDAHPQLTIPPETHFVPKLIRLFDEMEAQDLADDERRERGIALICDHPRWGDFGLAEGDLRARAEARATVSAGEIARAFFEAYADREGKPRWGDKSPPYTWKVRKIQRGLPEAHFIHLIRDGRDVALSQIAVSWGPSGITEAADKWVEELGRARKRARKLTDDTYIEERYEDLVTDPEPVLRRIAAFVDLPWDDAMLTYHEGAENRMKEVVRELKPAGGGTITAEERVSQHELVSKPPSSQRAGRWREEMSASDQAAYEAIAGELLAELGYEV